ncbi:MAG TPA: hypothetical protein VME43_12095 [Bryobacteraceae bacterium]|nr:hypothetical protein [Bryobacteraceae bacterium]
MIQAQGVSDGPDYLFKGPNWMNDTNFDIYCKSPPTPLTPICSLMMRSSPSSKG